MSLGAGKKTRFRKYGHIVLKKILPAFTIWYFVYAMLMAVKHPDNVGVLSMLSGYLRLANTGHLWFLFLLIQLYLLFPFLRKCYNHPLLGRFTILFVIAAVYLTKGLFQPNRSLAFAAPYVALLFSFNTAYFVLGFYLKDYAFILTRYARKPPFVLTGLLAFGVIESFRIKGILGVSTGGCFVDSCEMASVFATSSNIVTLVLLYLLSDWIYARGGRMKTLLSSYGLYSYGIYLAHIVPMALSYSILRMFIHSDNDVVIIGNLIATVILSKLFVKGLSKLPFSEYYV